MRIIGGSSWLQNIQDNFTELDMSVSQNYFVDTIRGSVAGVDGKSWAAPFSPLASALAAAVTGSKIFIFGDIREELVGSNLKFDIHIIGVGSKHHADVPGAGYHPGGSVWRPPASPTTATPLLKLRGRGWKFENILFDCPVDAAAIYMERNALSGLLEYDPSHASFLGCDFRNGLYGIQDVGGAFNVRVEDCDFETIDASASAAAIINTSTAVAAPRRWVIQGNRFQTDSSTEGNERHVVAPLNGSNVEGNSFGTVKGTGKYVDLTGGVGNIVTRNLFGGAYDTADYVAGTGDLWYGNDCAVKAVTAPDGRTLTVPGA